LTDLNGYVLRWDQDEALDFVLPLAMHEIRLDHVIAFLRARMHPKALVDSEVAQ
jgi:prophage maintenance system killer protein